MKTIIEKLKNYNIGVLSGGCSSERDVSLKSGNAVFNALSKLGLNVVFIDIKEESMSFLEKFPINLAFIALHGAFGEDGKIQSLLEEKKILYTGSGPEASHLAMDKIESKIKFRENNINTPGWNVVESSKNISFNKIKYPCVVKPHREGSSVGLSVVKSKEYLKSAVAKAEECSENILIEDYIDGRELTVGILGREALPIVEIIAAGGVYDFNAKYAARDTEYIPCPSLGDDVTFKIQELAKKAHLVLGCEGVSRVDIRLNSDNEPFVLEVNTIPGLTERSLLPMSAKARGIDFTELCVRILASAFNPGLIEKPRQNIGIH
ncbi:D-alanine--D-alanine ligase [Candidatus Omnitrophus magneticus]|uniref:D-alanine--D-alanine ligase n=1 Tax=Candidatus Omnitrophus magneticus TaxID=1609969 RepID=A0A0F0CR60_9BACT|nr:D-alanine--D-alanine ligase [Candidatus Omnitrophus magneticus]KJJ85808.1 D-alanine--D-alanine ligase [Candidatus Omnitrophus magneticus]